VGKKVEIENALNIAAKDGEWHRKKRNCVKMKYFNIKQILL